MGLSLHVTWVMTNARSRSRAGSTQTFPIFPDWMHGEEGARRALPNVIAAGVAALLVDRIGTCWWW